MRFASAPRSEQAIAKRSRSLQARPGLAECRRLDALPSPLFKIASRAVVRDRTCTQISIPPAGMRRLCKDGATVTTTPQLFDLLVFLVDRAGTLVTKEDLLNGLWSNANVTENALARAVSELRQLLGDNARDPQYIKTVARRGYRFIAPVQSMAVHPAAPASSRILSEGQESPPVVAVLNS